MLTTIVVSVLLDVSDGVRREESAGASEVQLELVTNDDKVDCLCFVLFLFCKLCVSGIVELAAIQLRR